MFGLQASKTRILNPDSQRNIRTTVLHQQSINFAKIFVQLYHGEFILAPIQKMVLELLFARNVSQLTSNYLES